MGGDSEKSRVVPVNKFEVMQPGTDSTINPVSTAGYCRVLDDADQHQLHVRRVLRNG